MTPDCHAQENSPEDGTIPEAAQFKHLQLGCLSVDVVIQQADWLVGDMAGIAEQAAATAQAAYLAGLAANNANIPDGENAGLAEICIRLTDDAEVAALNKTWRGKSGPTNVLSFPAAFPAELPETETAKLPEMLGDIVLARETLMREADAAGVLLMNHFRHLVVHGVLHLLGYDHEQSAEAEIMEPLEVQILAAMDIPSPYQHGDAA